MAVQVDGVTLLAYLRAPDAFEKGDKRESTKALVDVLNTVAVTPGSSALTALTSGKVDDNLRQVARDAKASLPDAQQKLAEARQEITALKERQKELEALIAAYTDELTTTDQKNKEQAKKIADLESLVEQLNDALSQ